MQRFSNSSGFSLIELMIVISIVGILAVIALPSYQSYTQKARFAEVISSTQLFKTAVALALQQGIPMAELANGKHGLPAAPKSTKNVASIKIENGVITATGTELVDGTTYILKPTHDGSTWDVSGSCVKSGLCHA
jgi:prepilin-type N-terminal cleavage/methylation domain-containing protein